MNDNRKPEADVYTSGSGMVLLTTSNNGSQVELCLNAREAFELAAALEYHADLSIRGIQSGMVVDIEP